MLKSMLANSMMSMLARHPWSSIQALLLQKGEDPKHNVISDEVACQERDEK